MKIDCSEIPALHNIEAIKALIEKEISDGKLKQFKIEYIQRQLPVKKLGTGTFSDKPQAMR